MYSMSYVSWVPMLAMAMSLLTTSVRGADIEPTQSMLIGWAQGDITPTRPAALGGMTYMRIASEVMDPLTVTALALEAPYQKDSTEPIILVSCDLTFIYGTTAKAVRAQLKTLLPAFDPQRVILFATHCHNAPPLYTYGQKTDAMDEPEYLAFAAPRIADVIVQAWNNRRPGGISFGLAHATVGHNRLMSYQSGKSIMGGNINDPEFSHVEGFEDSAVQLLYTWNEQSQLTGVIVNTPVTAQVSQRLSIITADIWHDTRVELRRRLGEKLFVLPQVSAAGDLMSNTTIHQRAEARMEKLTGQNRRQQIAVRLADAVTSILPVMEKNVLWDPQLAHRSEMVPLQRRIITPQELDEAQATVQSMKEQLAQTERELTEKPELKNNPKWVKTTGKYRWDLGRAQQVIRKSKQSQDNPTMTAELHVIRLGDMAMATNPFELYIDYGARIIGRSKAVQTFLVELACDARGYLPTKRAVAGGAYGAVPASNEVGPEGGSELVNWTVENINSFWPSPPPVATSQPAISAPIAVP